VARFLNAAGLFRVFPASAARGLEQWAAFARNDPFSRLASLSHLLASLSHLFGAFTDSSLRPLYHLAVTRIEISAAAYAALAASATRGLLEPQRTPEGGYSIWLAPKALKRLEAVRGPSESYSDAILRLAETETTDQ
jgi:hypothetical protein